MISGWIFYVIVVLCYVDMVGVFMIGLVCNVNFKFVEVFCLMIEFLVGFEVISGLIWLKVGIVIKLVLNMLIMVMMVKFGKIYGN